MPRLDVWGALRLAAEYVGQAGKLVFRYALGLGAVLAFVGAAGYGVYSVYKSVAPRTVRVCIATDPSFRVGKPDWQSRIPLWFAEVNRVFAGAGVVWSPLDGGDMSLRADASLDQRRIELEQKASCNGDVVLGLTGARDGAMSAAVYPFSHTLLLWSTDADSDTAMAIRLTRSLSHLFGVPGNADLLLRTDAPQSDLLDGNSIALISKLRAYDFGRGAAALPGRWERRAQAALLEALPGPTWEKAVQAHRMLARAFSAGRNYPPAVAHLRQAVQANSRDASLRMELALTLQNNAESDAAIEELKEAVKLAPGDARPHALLGAMYGRRLRAYEAIAELRTAISLDPATPEYFAALADTLSMQAGRAEEATVALNTALRLSPGDPDLLQEIDRLHRALTIAEDDLKSAEAWARQNPQSADAHYQLGRAAMKASHVDEAFTAFERAVALDPSNGDPHLALSRVHFDRGNYGAAKAELAVARKLGVHIPPGFESALGAKFGTAPELSYRY